MTTPAASSTKINITSRMLTLLDETSFPCEPGVPLMFTIGVDVVAVVATSVAGVPAAAPHLAKQPVRSQDADPRQMWHDVHPVATSQYWLDKHSECAVQ